MQEANPPRLGVNRSLLDAFVSDREVGAESESLRGEGWARAQQIDRSEGRR